MSIKRHNKLNAISAFMIASLCSASAAAAPLALEGPIQAIAADGSSITVMGMTVAIPLGTLINSPTKALTPEELVSTATFPGRVQQGFLGGTAIINGLTADDPANPLGVDFAEDIFVEPAENVLLGSVSFNGCGTATCDGAGDQLFISGVPMVRLADSRIPAGAPIDANALAIDLTTTPVLSEAAAEGYFGNDNNFYYFALETVGAPVSCGVNCRPSDAVSIARARCRDGREIQVSGGVADANGGAPTSLVVDIVDFGTAPVIYDAALNEATYSARININGACPASVTVNYKAATVSGNVDIR
jgi:hypothetical protein